MYSRNANCIPTIGLYFIGLEAISLGESSSKVKLKEGKEKNNIKFILMKSPKRHKEWRFLETIKKNISHNI